MMNNNYSLLFYVCLLSNIATIVSGHGILTKPKSKNAGSFTTPSLEASDYFGLASFGIIDKAFFDGDHGETPWTRPGEFDFYAAQDLIPGHPQTLHPCGCNAAVNVEHCVGVYNVATGYGETTLGAVPGTPPQITPPSWALGTTQETGFNLYANHGGGYIFMLCKKTDYDECRDSSFPNGPLMATEDETNRYLQCVWDCFEGNTLEWADDDDVKSSSSQRVQYEDDECTYAMTEPQTKMGKDDHIWRTIPIPDTTQITNGGEGRCTWDSVMAFSNDLAETKFTESFGTEDVCDTGPHAHNPKSWHIIDQVKIPSDIETGEYLLSWRWDAYMADQMWTNCADVQIIQTPSPLQEDTADRCPSNSPAPAPVSDPESNSPVSAPVSDPNIFKPVPESPSTCVDNALTGNWGESGRICDTYENHGGTAYCAHSVLNDACCFCGGGKIELQDSSTWIHIDKKGQPKGCDWVGKNPNKRCNKKGEEINEEDVVVRAKNACLRSCL